ncbi:serpin B6-like isoform 2-T2 [Synchiropus picturatus]
MSAQPLSSANTAFCLDLLKKFCDNDKTSNVFYSPFSISSALAMVMLGARGDTLSQMSEALCFSKAKMSEPQMAEEMQQQVQHRLPPCLQRKALKTVECQEVHQSFGDLLKELHNKDASYKLSVANRLYGEQSYEFVQDFLENSKKFYRAELECVDFIKNYEAARLNINSWVEAETNSKIKDLLAQGVLDGLTRLVLVNAIYFKGNWDKKFKENHTSERPFKTTKNNTKPVKMMNQKSKFPFTYIPEVNCQVLELPYVGKDLSMLIFLPNEKEEMEDGSTGLEELERELNNDTFAEWTRPDMMDEVEVQVSLPRFKLEETYDMKNVLISMGMVDAFDVAKSNFSGMSKNNDLSVSKVVHKAFVEVNEEGTEAAAATAAVMMLRCHRPSERFNADHPFLFFIRHNPSKSVLFAGRFCTPV